MMRNKFKAAGFSAESLERIRMLYESPRGDAGVALLERYLTEYPEIRFVVVDSLTRFRTVPDAKTPAFIADYETLARLHDLTNRRPGLAIDVVHHTRKAKSEDPIDDISGTYGLTAACDTYWVLRAHEDGAVLHVGGRYWTRDESEYKLKRALQRWQLAGTFTGLTRTQEDHLTILRDGNGIFAAEFGRRAGITKQSAGDALRLLVDRGRAQQRNGLFYEKT